MKQGEHGAKETQAAASKACGSPRHLVDEQVLRLQVAVHNLVLVADGDTFQQLVQEQLCDSDGDSDGDSDDDDEEKKKKKKRKERRRKRKE